MGSAGKLFGTMLRHFMIPFNLISNMTVFQKSYDFDLLPASTRSRGGRPAIKKIYYRVAVIVISFYLVCNMTMF